MARLKPILPLVEPASIPEAFILCKQARPAKVALVDPADTEENEFNRLNYGCRELYAETAGWELKFNDIHISRRWDIEEYMDEQFWKFFETIFAKKHWLQGAHIMFGDAAPYDAEDTRPGDIGSLELTSKIAALCNAHPYITVTSCFDMGTLWNGELTAFVMACAAFGMFIRGTNCFDILPPVLQAEMVKQVGKLLQMWGHVRIETVRAPNFRFRPTWIANTFEKQKIATEIERLAKSSHPKLRVLMERPSYPRYRNGLRLAFKQTWMGRSDAYRSLPWCLLAIEYGSIDDSRSLIR